MPGKKRDPSAEWEQENYLEVLSTLEESIIRMRTAKQPSQDDNLWPKLDPALQQRLLQLELRAFEQTGRLEELRFKAEKRKSKAEK